MEGTAFAALKPRLDAPGVELAEAVEHGDPLALFKILKTDAALSASRASRSGIRRRPPPFVDAVTVALYKAPLFGAQDAGRDVLLHLDGTRVAKGEGADGTQAWRGISAIGWR